MLITYIRHAKQTSHAYIDPPIINTGLNKKIDTEYDLIICSPYLRCRQTAQKINVKNVPIYVDVRLAEYQYVGKNHKYNEYDNQTLEYGDIPSCGETWEEFMLRIESMHEYIINYVSSLSKESNYKNIKICVVTHGIVVKSLNDALNVGNFYRRGRDVPFTEGFSIYKEII